MKPIYILGAGNFAQEVYSEVFLQGNASDHGLFGGYIYISKLDNTILIDLENNEKGFDYPKDACFILATGVKKWRQKFIEIFTKKYPISEKHFPNVWSDSVNISPLASYGIGNVFLWNTLVRANAEIGNFNPMGDNNVLASSSVVVTKISMGNDNTVSAGEVVFDNMSDRKFFQSGIITDKP